MIVFDTEALQAIPKNLAGSGIQWRIRLWS